jgi:Ca-activated chloride channel homolog
MSFIWQSMLYSLLLIPVLILGYLMLLRHRRHVLSRANSVWIEAALQRQNTGGRRHIPIVLFMTGIAILLIALARPQAVVQIPRIEGTIILGFDVSGSMAAEDAQPNRLEAAKAIAVEFVQSQPSTVQIGVVAFSNNAFAVQPPTNDQAQILDAIDRLIPQQGTSLGQGIMAALNTIDSSYGQPVSPEEGDQASVIPDLPALIVLMSDGENTEAPDPFEVALYARERGIQIHSIGIGSRAGTVVEINGFNVHTRLDEYTLQQIASISGGKYFQGSGDVNLQEIYTQLTPQLIVKPEEVEVTSILAGVSMLVMLVGGFLSLLWFNRLP